MHTLPAEETTPMRVIVASENPVKVEAVRRALQRLFPNRPITVQGCRVDSGVADQPRSDSETLAGARNRAEAAAIAHPDADLWVGIEGGVEERPEGMASFAWVVVRSPRGLSPARSGTFFLPPAVARLVRQGYELGDADDRVFGLHNSKQQMGAVGLLTHGVIDRTALYCHAVTLALIPLVRPELYPDRSPTDEA